MSTIFGIIIFLALVYCGQKVYELLESEETPLFKYFIIVIFIGLIAVAIFGIYSLQLEKIFTTLKSYLGPISEFFSNLFNSDDKIKFLFQNDFLILQFIVLVLIAFVVVGIILVIFGVSYTILSVFTAYLLYLPCRYFYLLLWGDKSIVKNARAKSKIFQIFEFLVWGLVALIILSIYLKVKNSYLS